MRTYVSGFARRAPVFKGPAAGFGFGPKGNRHVQGGMGHALHGFVFASGRGRWVRGLLLL